MMGNEVVFDLLWSAQWEGRISEDPVACGRAVKIHTLCNPFPYIIKCMF